MVDLLMTWLSAIAAGFLACRSFNRLHAIGRCSTCWREGPHLIRCSAWMMAVSAVAIVLGAIGGEAELVEWGRTFALVSVALHICADHRKTLAGVQMVERRAT